MPHYEFFCNACKKPFSKILTMAEHDAERTACPHCSKSRGRTELVCLLRCHLEEERLNPPARVGVHLRRNPQTQEDTVQDIPR